MKAKRFSIFTLLLVLARVITTVSPVFAPGGHGGGLSKYDRERHRKGTGVRHQRRNRRNSRYGRSSPGRAVERRLSYPAVVPSHSRLFAGIAGS